MPPRGIGKVTLAKIFEGKEEELGEIGKRKVQDFRGLMREIAQETKMVPPSLAIKLIMKRTGLEEFLKADTLEGEERLQNLGELVTLATKYDALPEGERLEKFLEDAALASDQDALIENKNGVKLMTIHAAKGLEFECVFISGLEQDLFPHKRMNQDSVTAEESEEERRLFYVAITRAKKKLHLTYASVRTIFGGRQINVPSEFITDIEEDLLDEIGGREKRVPIKTIYLD